MISAKTISNLSSADMLKKAVHIASYYGFDPIEKIALEQKKQRGNVKERKTPIQKVSKQDIKNYKKDLLNDEMISALEKAAEYGLLPSDQPIMIHRSSICDGSNKTNREETVRFSLVTVGMNKSIAEALILKTACAILDDIGIGEIQVYINSVGDKDSTQKFAHELNSYIRKNADSLPTQARQSMKKDIFSVYEQLHMMRHPFETEMPQSIKSLSDRSRKHLSEVLEYLETGGVPYEIDNFLIGNGDFYSQTLFEIRHVADKQVDEISILAKGSRSEEIPKRLFRLNMPAVAIVFEFEKKGIKERELNTLKRTRKPKLYFIQLGYEAKLKSLHIIDTLRKANVPLYHNLNNDKFGEQLAFAQYLKVPYTIIMGHREALDSTVIVRDMNTQSQNIVPVDELPAYLKEIPI